MASLAVCPGLLGKIFSKSRGTTPPESQIVGKFGLLKLPKAVVLSLH
jgi:hypothetical protein